MNKRVAEGWRDRNAELRSQKLTIAIDYDGTYAADPEGWAEVIHVLRARGHTIVMVTNRTNDFDWGAEVTREAHKAGVPVLICGTAIKAEYAHSHGYDVDIWIDDLPETIHQGGWQ